MKHNCLQIMSTDVLDKRKSLIENTKIFFFRYKLHHVEYMFLKLHNIIEKVYGILGLTPTILFSKFWKTICSTIRIRSVSVNLTEKLKHILNLFRSILMYIVYIWRSFFIQRRMYFCNNKPTPTLINLPNH